MTADVAADVNARYSTFVNAPREMGMIKVASWRQRQPRRL